MYSKYFCRTYRNMFIWNSNILSLVKFEYCEYYRMHKKRVFYETDGGQATVVGRKLRVLDTKVYTNFRL